MSVDTTSGEWSLGLLIGYALGSPHVELQQAAEQALAIIGSGEDEETASPAPDDEGEDEVPVTARRGRWGRDEEESLQELIGAGHGDEAIIQALLQLYGRKREGIERKLAEVRA